MKAFTTHVNNLVQGARGTMLGICLVLVLGGAGFHDFHFSRTDARWNPVTQTVQTTVRVFTDDLEAALRLNGNLRDDVKLWLGDDGEWPGADSLIHEWLQANLVLGLGETSVEWAWVGKEVELDVSFLYVESQLMTNRSPLWHAANSLFLDVFDDQVNEVHLHDVLTGGVAVERREMLNAEWPSLDWDSSAPADSGVDD